MSTDNSTSAKGHEACQCSLAIGDRDRADLGAADSKRSFPEKESARAIGTSEAEDESVQIAWGFVNTNRSVDMSSRSHAVGNEGIFNRDRPNSSALLSLLSTSPPSGLSSFRSNGYGVFPPSMLGYVPTLSYNQGLPWQLQQAVRLQNPPLQIDFQGARSLQPALSSLEPVAPDISIFERRASQVVSSAELVAKAARSMNREPVAPDQFPTKHPSASPSQEYNSTGEAIVVVKKPKRPLTAYNIFFRDQRRLMLEDRERRIKDATGAKKEAMPCSIGFESMAKIIAKKWKNIDAETSAKYKEKAREDTCRYEKEQAKYKRYQTLELEARRAAMEMTVPDDVKRRYFG